MGLCEEACVVALRGELEERQTSVGTRIELAHLSPVGVGTSVRASATLERAEGRRLTFAVSVTDRCGLVAAGKVTRVIVDQAEFLSRTR